MKWLDKTICFFKNHIWKDGVIFDSEEWMADRYEDAMHRQRYCTRCGYSEERFFGWGTMAEHKDALARLAEEESKE